MTVFKRLPLVSFAMAAMMFCAAGPLGAADGTEKSAAADTAAASRLFDGQQLAARCRRICVQRQRQCHTERRCSYATNRCRNVRVCNTVCAMYGYGPPGCRP